ncbi:uncharacterized protein BDR25DRAFT_359023 [Lindgomyces ingoldianus]|uniref:Uncharacterized protein n=1 Tax=Lindgomyces ingoldianus TaxID=673940 RepID=A0ACB6QKB9_9PLEO|nr:uncharacterized protein BDR25DRAFT_359023 [Lindgomyces ingoldianus]KAF2466960.1 hypothetical protein BDR25DRAFT_359023 [Lindgomyces ingoldianus]
MLSTKSVSGRKKSLMKASRKDQKVRAIQAPGRTEHVVAFSVSRASHLGMRKTHTLALLQPPMNLIHTSNGVLRSPFDRHLSMSFPLSYRYSNSDSHLHDDSRMQHLFTLFTTVDDNEGVPPQKLRLLAMSSSSVYILKKVSNAVLILDETVQLDSSVAMGLGNNIKPKTSNIPGYMCFSFLLEPFKTSRRPAFTKKRRKCQEVIILSLNLLYRVNPHTSKFSAPLVLLLLHTTTMPSQPKTARREYNKPTLTSI